MNLNQLHKMLFLFGVGGQADLSKKEESSGRKMKQDHCISTKTRNSECMMACIPIKMQIGFRTK